VRQADELLSKLALTDQERVWAKQPAKAAFKGVSDALLDNGQALGELRAAAVPAALAYALMIAKDWAAELAPHRPSRYRSPRAVIIATDEPNASLC
jgi:hypothetical protein